MAAWKTVPGIIAPAKTKSNLLFEAACHLYESMRTNISSCCGSLRLELTSSLTMQPRKDRSVNFVPLRLSDSYDELPSSPLWDAWLIEFIAPESQSFNQRDLLLSTTLNVLETIRAHG